MSGKKKLPKDSETNIGNSNPIILHLSDLHFGWQEDDRQKNADREVVLNGLIDLLANLEPEWRPNIICITGDIGWKGKDTDYLKAKKWLEKLLEVLSISFNEVVLCIGNHDADRNDALKLARPVKTAEADRILGYQPAPEHYKSIFSAYKDFCIDSNIPTFDFGDHQSFLVGQRSINDINFLALNSAWFSQDDFDKEKLWIGQPHLKYLESKDQLKLITENAAHPITIVLTHHPKEWLNLNEQASSGNNRPSTWDYLAKRSDIILSGHTHGTVRDADRIVMGAYHLTSGASFAGAHFFNNIRLIRIEDRRFVYRSFESDPRATENTWKPSGETTTIDLRQDPKRTEAETLDKYHVDLHALRSSACQNAKETLIKKSRLLKSDGQLPEVTPLKVVIRDNLKVSKPDRLSPIRNQQQREMSLPIFEAVRLSRSTLLLGDLGGGKSTLACQLVCQTINAIDGALAFLIPVKQLRLQTPFRIKDLVDSMSDYISSQITPTSKKLDLSQILRDGTETSLIFDGLDEISSSIASELLKIAAELTNHWPNILVLATARPVELQGLDYSAWKVIQTQYINDEDLRNIYINELLAEGKSAEIASDEAADIIRTLKRQPSLYSVINTPLAARMIFPRLKELKDTTEPITLGDLIYDLLLERMGKWTTRDGKSQPCINFDNVFPTPVSKVNILGVLAFEVIIGQNNQLQFDVALRKIQDQIIATYPKLDKYQIGEEALNYIAQSGIIALGDIVDFPIQPLAEMATAIRLVENLRNGNLEKIDLPSKNWRVVSFIATVIRRLGLSNEYRSHILEYTEVLLKETDSIAAACYIVKELNDQRLANDAISQFQGLGRRPITIFQDEWEVSTTTIAHVIFLSGDNGFNWFYEEYLDPHYPFAYYGGGVIEDIFKAYATSVGSNLKDKQRAKLKKLVQPHLACPPSLYILPILSIMIPESFESEKRFWFQSRLMSSSFIGSKVIENLKNAYHAGNQNIINKILLNSSSDRPNGILLWLELNPNTPPTSEVGRKLLKGAAKSRRKSAYQMEIDKYCQKIGFKHWIAFLRWCLFDSDSEISAAAAIQLYNNGEHSYNVLGPALIGGLHDGGLINEAKAVLYKVVKDSGEQGIRSFAEDFINQSRGNSWHSSSCWNILLDFIDRTGENCATILSNAVGIIDEYTLARYPELRHKFRVLLKGEEGNANRTSLKKQLEHPNPAIRHGAAMVLTTTFPESESQALFIVVQARVRDNQSDWHEWEAFCLTLKFSSSVLTHLKNQLTSLNAKCRVFGLAILAQNNHPLTPEEEEELIRSLIVFPNYWLEDTEIGRNLLGSELAFTIFVDSLNKQIDLISKSYAEKLLKYHKSKLSAIEEAKCIAITLNWKYLTINLSDFLKRLENDPPFQNNLKQTLIDIHSQSEIVLPAEHLLNAFQNQDKWKDVIWSIFCDDEDTFSDFNEEIAFTIIEWAKKHSGISQVIGNAAKEFLDSPCFQSNRWVDKWHWLALLADCLASEPFGHNWTKS